MKQVTWIDKNLQPVSQPAIHIILWYLCVSHSLHRSLPAESSSTILYRHNVVNSFKKLKCKKFQNENERTNERKNIHSPMVMMSMCNGHVKATAPSVNLSNNFRVPMTTTTTTATTTYIASRLTFVPIQLFSHSFGFCSCCFFTWSLLFYVHFQLLSATCQLTHSPLFLHRIESTVYSLITFTPISGSLLTLALKFHKR